MNNIKELDERARHLRNAAPQEFFNFVAAFARYTSQMMENFVFTTENLSVAQGQAQMVLKVLRTLEEASKNG